MPAFVEILIKDWQSVLELAERYDLGDGWNPSYLFRGQPNFAWAITPTLHRAATDDMRLPLPEARSLLIVEQSLSDRFIAAASNHLHPATVESNKSMVDWWTVMRHHGVPTRVIDWTQSIFVAAYFACSGGSKDDGAIYALHAGSVQNRMRELYGDTAKFPASASVDGEFTRPDSSPIVHLAKRKNALLDRMLAQQGHFMINRNVRAELEDVLEGCIPFKRPADEVLCKYRVPAALKPTAMRRLRAMNVTGASLFPGLDGIGRQLDELTRYR